MKRGLVTCIACSALISGVNAFAQNQDAHAKMTLLNNNKATWKITPAMVS